MTATTSLARRPPVAPRARPALIRPVRGLASGTTLFREGDPVTSLYEVASGTLRLTRVLETGRRQVVAFAHRGDIVGFPAAGAHHADCDALTGASVIAHRRAALDDSRPDPDLHRRLHAAALTEIARLQDHLLLLARKGAAGKLASFLGDLADRQGTPQMDGVAIDLELPRADIADYLCITIETVSRMLTRMCEAGLVRRDSISRLVVTDRAGLDAMACMN